MFIEKLRFLAHFHGNRCMWSALAIYQLSTFRKKVSKERIFIINVFFFNRLIPSTKSPKKWLSSSISHSVECESNFGNGNEKSNNYTVQPTTKIIMKSVGNVNSTSKEVWQSIVLLSACVWCILQLHIVQHQTMPVIIAWAAFCGWLISFNRFQFFKCFSAISRDVDDRILLWTVNMFALLGAGESFSKKRKIKIVNINYIEPKPPKHDFSIFT